MNISCSNQINMPSLGFSAIEKVVESKVLLVFIQNKRGITISHEFLRSLFKNYGSVLKVYIFQKTEMWKAFIEMGSSMEAKNALLNLNNINLFNCRFDGKVTIEFSRLNDLNSVIETLEGRKFFGENGQDKKNPLKLNRSNTFQIDFEAEKKSELQNKEKKILYNPLGFFKRSKTLESDGKEEINPNLKKEIIRGLDLEKSYELIPNNLNEEETKQDDLEVFSLRNIETQSTINTLNNSYKEENVSNQFGVNAKNSFFPNPQGFVKMDIFINFIKNFKIEIPKSRSSSLVGEVKRKISIGINTSKEPSPINNNQKNAFQPPNFLESALKFHNNLLINNISHQIVYPSYFQPFHSMPNISPAIGFNNVSQNSTLNSSFSSLMGGNNISRVLYVRGLDNPFIKVEMIYNLFSNFGDIIQIMYLKNKGCALVEYENTEFANLCKDLLNNMKFFTNHLRIYYSNYQRITLQKRSEKDLNGIEEILICTPAMYRFKGQRAMSINPPTNTLHVSNLKLEVCNEERIMKIFGQYGKIEGIRFLFMENNKNMCLIKYCSIEAAFISIAYLHNFDIDGRCVKISFTKTKI